jgi:hypothetical protein
MHVEGIYQWQEHTGSVSFDAFAKEGDKTACFLLTPQSYKNEPAQMLDGDVLFSDHNSIAAQNKTSFLLYPKIHKRAIYLNFLTHLLPSHPETASLALSLLE